VQRLFPPVVVQTTAPAMSANVVVAMMHPAIFANRAEQMTVQPAHREAAAMTHVHPATPAAIAAQMTIPQVHRVAAVTTDPATFVAVVELTMLPAGVDVNEAAAWTTGQAINKL
jgi:hypothetical protein